MSSSFFTFLVFIPAYAGCVKADFCPVGRTRFLCDRYHYFFTGKKLRTKATYKFYISDVFCPALIYYAIFRVGTFHYIVRSESSAHFRFERVFTPKVVSMYLVNAPCTQQVLFTYRVTLVTLGKWGCRCNINYYWIAQWDGLRLSEATKRTVLSCLDTTTRVRLTAHDRLKLDILQL